MDELQENIIYDAMQSIMDNAKAILDLVNIYGTDEDKKAYRAGVYAPAIKLQVVLGQEGMARGKARYDEIYERIRAYVARGSSPNSVIHKGAAFPELDSVLNKGQ